MRRISSKSQTTKFFALLVLILIVLLTVFSSLHKSATYDEAITLLELSGQAEPNWPREIIEAKELRLRFENVSGFGELMASLRDTDVHPPLYYTAAWLLHSISGPSVFLQRILSTCAVMVGLLALLVHWRRMHPDQSLPQIAAFAAIFLTLPSLHFAATSVRAYGLAIAFLCIAYAAAHALMTDSRGRGRERWLAGVVGLACGAAVATHYLALVMVAVMWIGAFASLARRRHIVAILALAAGAAPFLGLAAAFLATQIDARPEQDAGFVGVLQLTGLLLGKIFMSVPNATVPYPLLALVSAMLSALAIVGAVFAARAAARGVLFPLFLAGIHLLSVIALSWASDKSLDAARYLGLAGPFLALVLADGATWLSSLRPASRVWSIFPWILVAGQAALVTSVLVARTDEGVLYANVAERVSSTPPTSSILLTDAGYGRGQPAAVALAVAPETRLWIRELRDLEVAELQALPDNVRHVHVMVAHGYPDSLLAFRTLHAALTESGWITEEMRLPYLRYLRAHVP